MPLKLKFARNRHVWQRRAMSNGQVYSAAKTPQVQKRLLRDPLGAASKPHHAPPANRLSKSPVKRLERLQRNTCSVFSETPSTKGLRKPSSGRRTQPRIFRLPQPHLSSCVEPASTMNRISHRPDSSRQLAVVVVPVVVVNCCGYVCHLSRSTTNIPMILQLAAALATGTATRRESGVSRCTSTRCRSFTADHHHDLEMQRRPMF